MVKRQKKQNRWDADGLQNLLRSAFERKKNKREETKIQKQKGQVAVDKRTIRT